MSGLSRDTLRLIDILYPEDRQRIAQMLESELDAEKIGCAGWSPEQMERIRFAVLKLGLGGGRELEKAKDLARVDWRDVLVSAGFGEDIEAHRIWWESVVC